MARRSKDPNQSFLFDTTPTKSAKSKRIVPEIDYKPLYEPTVFLIGYKNKEEAMHWASPLSDSDNAKKSLEESNYTVKVYSSHDYYEKFNAGEFTLGQP